MADIFDEIAVEDEEEARTLSMDPGSGVVEKKKPARRTFALDPRAGVINVEDRPAPRKEPAEEEQEGDVFDQDEEEHAGDIFDEIEIEATPGEGPGDIFDQVGSRYAKDRGFIGDTVSYLARGAANLGEQVGGALRMSDIDPSEDEGFVSKLGKKITEGVESAREKYDILKPDMEEEDAGLVSRGYRGFLESAPSSAAPMAAGFAGAKVGAAAGTAVAPGVGTAIGAAAGAIIGAGATMFGLFGLGEYQNSYDDAEKALRRQGLAEDEVRAKAGKHALISSTAEVGGEVVGDLAAMTFFGALGKQAAKQSVKQTIKQVLSGPGFITALAKTVPFEVGSEMGTAYFQGKSAKEVGLTDAEPSEAVKEAILPAVFMSLFFGAGIRGVQAYEAHQIYNDLNSDDVEKRVGAARVVAQRLDEENRRVWLDTAAEHIEAGKPIPISKPIVDFAIQKADAEAAEPSDARGIVEGTLSPEDRGKSPREILTGKPDQGTPPDDQHGMSPPPEGPQPPFPETGPQPPKPNAPPEAPTPPDESLDAEEAAAGFSDEELEAAANEAATSPQNDRSEPTDDQKVAGNFKKGHPKPELTRGFAVTIENPKGSTRTETKPKGATDDWRPSWSTEMAHHYGYFRRSEGKDGDQIDVFLSEKPNEGKVFIVDQVDPKTGKFDEHKVMMGFADEQAARDAYLANYENGWKGLGAITEVTDEQLKEFIGSGKRQAKPFATAKESVATAKAPDETKDLADNTGHGRPKAEHPLTEPEAGSISFAALATEDITRRIANLEKSKRAIKRLSPKQESTLAGLKAELAARNEKALPESQPAPGGRVAPVRTTPSGETTALPATQPAAAPEAPAIETAAGDESVAGVIADPKATEAEIVQEKKKLKSQVIEGVKSGKYPVGAAVRFGTVDEIRAALKAGKLPVSEEYGEIHATPIMSQDDDVFAAYGAYDRHNMAMIIPAKYVRAKPDPHTKEVVIDEAAPLDEITFLIDGHAKEYTHQEIRRQLIEAAEKKAGAVDPEKIPSDLRIEVRDEAIPDGKRTPLARAEHRRLSKKLDKLNALLDCLGV